MAAPLLESVWCGVGITSSLLAALCLCRRIPLEDIPEDDDRCSAWLHKLYQEKVSALGAGGLFMLQLWVRRAAVWQQAFLRQARPHRAGY